MKVQENPTEESEPVHAESPSLSRALIQRTVGWLILFPCCGLIVVLLRFVGRYSVKNMQEIRRAYKELAQEGGPLLICANHLTFIDSVIMLWAMGSLPWYFLHYNYFSWNLPAGDVFKKKLTYRIVAYLAKCVFIHRDGTRTHRSAILDLCRALIERGEVVTIFPEGQRSRTGRIDTSKLTFGAGKIVASMTHCRVLCVYLRSDLQKAFSNFPKRGSKFHLELKPIQPKSDLVGRLAYREITGQIMSVLEEMEERYFASMSSSPNS